MPVIANHQESLLARLLDSQPVEALYELREQIEADLRRAQDDAKRLGKELSELDRSIRAREGQPELPPRDPRAPGLRAALLTLLEEARAPVPRDALWDELLFRGWGPGGRNPRNTFISRLSELVNSGHIERDDEGSYMLSKGSKEAGNRLL